MTDNAPEREGTAAGDQLAGITLDSEQADHAVPGDDGPELPGEPGDSGGHA